MKHDGNKRLTSLLLHPLHSSWLSPLINFSSQLPLQQELSPLLWGRSCTGSSNSHRGNSRNCSSSSGYGKSHKNTVFSLTKISTCISLISALWLLTAKIFGIKLPDLSPSLLQKKDLNGSSHFKRDLSCICTDCESTFWMDILITKYQV